MSDFDITSRKNERVRHMKRLGASGEYRRECGEYLCDGGKLLGEAIKWGADVREVLYRGERPELPAGVRAYSCTPEVMEAASPMKAPQQVLFTVGMPKRERPGSLAGAIILENIQDPGNVGTVLRCANAFGTPLVVLTGDCADIFNPKTVRASMGAVFRQRTAELDLREIGELADSACIYGAALRAGARDIREADLSDAAVAVGNEGAGLSEAMLSLCAGTVIIPMSPMCESLNAAVAAAIIMWERARRGTVR